MRASIAIPACNEGPLLAKTVGSCLHVAKHEKDWEIVVADDASTDGSIEETLELYPEVRVVRFDERRGCAAAKDLAVRESKGEIIVLLDGHCKPELCSLGNLFDDVEEVGSEAIVTPRIPPLNAGTWENNLNFFGHGFGFDLEDFSCYWVPFGNLVWRDRFLESPAAVGCCLAMTRELYEKAGGFDTDMLDWGIEDIDFSLRVWLLGYSVLHDPAPMIGHRFRETFDTYSVASENVLANQMRMARKNFSDETWKDWTDRFGERNHDANTDRAWEIFREREDSVKAQKNDIHSRRRRDELWYAERFGLEWPLRATGRID